MENGDINWVIPNKFIAFSSPSEKQFDKFGVIVDLLRADSIHPTIMFPFLKDLE